MRHENGGSANRGLHWLLGVPGMALALAWGAAEGSFFFIVPDVITSLTTLFSVKKSLLQMLFVTVGSLAAGVSLFQWSQADYSTARNAVDYVPFVRESMFSKVQQDFDAYGARALLVGPTQGIPYKVYAIEAPGRCPLLPFLLVSVPARLERLLLSWVVFATAGFGLRKIRRWPVAAIVFHAGYWICVYVYYWTVI